MAFQNERKADKITDPNVALSRMESWCAYQERCQQEVRDKLYNLGLWPEAVESVIIELISRNFLNEERFAMAYAGGKFRIKRWGKQKIRMELKTRRIPDVLIRKALNQIDDQDYMAALEKSLSLKWNGEREKNPLKKKMKVMRYLMSRGFEQDLINDAMKNLTTE